MELFRVFHVFWILLSSLYSQHVCVYCSVFGFLVFAWPFAGTYDISATENEERLVLKSQDVLEGIPSSSLPRTPSISFVPTLPPEPSGPDCEDPDVCSDPMGYDAIRVLHRQLDDDANGNIDVAESDEFLRDELQYENGYERHKEFHGNDKYISVDELWQAWRTSEVHNWTVEETMEWLASYVDLPQYVYNFKNNAVDGSCLPRLAINTNHYMSVNLGIKDPIHRQKIALKAMDVVLFGPPRHHNYVKDVMLVMSLVIAIGGCWFAYVQHKYSQTHMQRMMKDMESLQNAEEALFELQKELNKARQEQEIVNIEKQNLERRLQDEITTAKQQLLHSHDGILVEGADQTRVLELEEQLRNARSDLHQAEKMLESRAWVAPPSLQHWLQLTHELELRHYNAKKTVAEKQLQSAKEGCEKLRRKRSTFMGAFRIAHGSSIDDVDDRIIQAKAALCEVTKDLQERMHRWKQIEILCGFPVVHNGGLVYLESILKGATVNGLTTLARSSSEGTLIRDESPPPYAAGISAVQQLVHTSAALFLVPVPPAYVNYSKETGHSNKTQRGLPHRDSGISLSSTVQLSMGCYSTVMNGALANIPPPSYSSPSASYIRKESLLNPSERAHSSAPSSKTVSTPALHFDSYSNPIDHQHSLEAPTEEDDETEDHDDGSTERSMTPPSCASYSGQSDSGRPVFSVGDSPTENNFSNPPTSVLLNAAGGDDFQHISHDKQSIGSNHLMEDTSTTPANGKVNSITPRKTSSGVLEKKKKSGKALVAALHNSFSSSNINEHEPSTEPTASGCEDKQKKKKFFPQLRRRKTKMM